MKIEPELAQYMYNAAKTANLVNIQSLIVEQDCIRGIDESNSVIIFDNKNNIDLPFEAIGITRIKTFITRYELASSKDNFNIDVTLNGNNIVQSLNMSGKGVKIDYRCGDPNKIKAPKKILDTPKYEIELDPEFVGMLQKGKDAVPDAVNFSIIYHKGVGSSEIIDTNNDVFKFDIFNPVIMVDEEDTSSINFNYKYPLKLILPLFKQDNGAKITIGVNGIMGIDINNLTIYVLPQV